MNRSLFLTLLLAGCAGSSSGAANPTIATADKPSAVADKKCAFKTAPTVVKKRGNAILKVWQFEEEAVFAASVIPSDSALAGYRQTIIDAGADLIRPLADEPNPKNAAEGELWQREAKNADTAFSGRAGRVRKIQCLEALLFGDQNRRYSQITQPTEFIASVLRKNTDGRTRLKVYLSGSDQMFPPKDFYGFDEAERDIANGWEFWFVLHNHTTQKYNGNHALGTPTLSTSDADLHRGLAERLKLQSARVTNGFFTAEIPARAFDQYLGRAPTP